MIFAHIILTKDLLISCQIHTGLFLEACICFAGARFITGKVGAVRLLARRPTYRNKPGPGEERRPCWWDYYTLIGLHNYIQWSGRACVATRSFSYLQTY